MSAHVIGRADGLFGRGAGVSHGRPVRVEVIGAEPAQAGLPGQHQVLAVAASGVGVGQSRETVSAAETANRSRRPSSSIPAVSSPAPLR